MTCRSNNARHCWIHLLLLGEPQRILTNKIYRWQRLYLRSLCPQCSVKGAQLLPKLHLTRVLFLPVQQLSFQIFCGELVYHCSRVSVKRVTGIFIKQQWQRFPALENSLRLPSSHDLVVVLFEFYELDHHLLNDPRLLLAVLDRDIFPGLVDGSFESDLKVSRPLLQLCSHLTNS